MVRGEFLQIVDDSGCVVEEAILMGGLFALMALGADSVVSTLTSPQRAGQLW